MIYVAPQLGCQRMLLPPQFNNVQPHYRTWCSKLHIFARRCTKLVTHTHKNWNYATSVTSDTNVPCNTIVDQGDSYFNVHFLLYLICSSSFDGWKCHYSDCWSHLLFVLGAGAPFLVRSSACFFVLSSTVCSEQAAQAWGATKSKMRCTTCPICSMNSYFE
jgi:hypothetical protein